MCSCSSATITIGDDVWIGGGAIVVPDVTIGAGAIVGGGASASSNTVFVESASGIAEGARTGLANIVTGVLFLGSMFFAPLIGVIPMEVGAAALVVVGSMMVAQIREKQQAKVEYDQAKKEGKTAALLEQHAGEVAAVILEPVVQGAGGMRIYHPTYLKRVRELCDRHRVLLIADEIATGFGRTGRWLACEGAGVAPDVLCLGKALTGGTMTGAAMLCTAEVAETVSRRERGMPGALLHGPTFMGNPLMCAVASASLDLLTDPRDGWAAQVPRVEAGLRAGLAAAADLPAVTDVRVLGAVGVVELDRTVDVEPVTRAAVARGAWVRPFRRLVYVMPPYVSTDDDVATICAAVTGAVEEVCA